MTEINLTEVKSAIDTLRSKVEEYKEAGLTQDKILAMDEIKKMNDFLNTYEAKNQELVAKEEKARKEAEEMAERVQDLEKAIATKSNEDPENYKESKEYISLQKFVKEGQNALFDAETKSYLRTDNNVQGGFLVPTMMASEILKEIEEISPVRALSRVRTTQTKSLDIPVRDSIPEAEYEGEAEQNQKKTSTYKSETLTAYRHSITTELTHDIINFANFDMSNEAGSDAARGFAKSEGRLFLQGTGSKQPEGILVNSDVEQVTTASSGVLSLDDLIQLAGELKEGYNPVYFFNRKTLYNLRTQKASSGEYLWTLGGERMPSEINGYRYVIMQDMPDIAANALAAGIGDFSMGYNILDSVQMALIRDDVTEARKALILLTWHRWNTGQVVLPEAFKLLKVKA